MRIVLDTNVLVSGIITPFGPCGEINHAVVAGKVSLCADARIVAEYNDVLRRPRLHLAAIPTDALLAYIDRTAEYFSTAPLPSSLPDRRDEPFLEVALAARADCVVTGNLRHFPAALRCGVPVLSPTEFLEFLRSGNPPRLGARTE